MRELVVKIDEELVCEGFERHFTEEEKDRLIKAIGNGKPLPKNHKRLIEDNFQVGPVYDKKGNLLGYQYVTQEDLNNAQTIIEADKPDYKDEVRKRCKQDLEITKILHESEDVYCYFMKKNFGVGDKVRPDIYSYFHDKLANYVKTRAKEEHYPLEYFEDIDRKFSREISDYLDRATTDCVRYGKRLFDCYQEIDELFAKYRELYIYHPFWRAYDTITECIISSSSKANVNPFDVVDRLAKNGYAPSSMAALLIVCMLSFDDVTSYVDNAINEVKKKSKSGK